QRVRSGLAVAEIAFAVLLVIAAGLLIRSFWSLSHISPGFQSAHVLTARITPNQSFCGDSQRCLTFYRGLLDQIRSSPSVSGAAAVNTLPLGGRVAKRSFNVEDHLNSPGNSEPLFWLNIVTPDYFHVMNIPFVSGRDLKESDSADSHVALITAETALRFWANQDAVGKHIRLLNDKDWRTVVGVVADVRAYDLQQNSPGWIGGTAYIPYNVSATLEDKRMTAEMTVVIRSDLNNSQTEGLLRSAMTNLNPEVPISEVKSMDAVCSEAVAAPRSSAFLFIVFSGLALTLGAIGI